MIGIYKITNKLNGKVYVGQSNDIERRFKEHQQKGESSKIPLDIAIQKYGKDNFTYEIIEECSLEELNSKEQDPLHKHRPSLSLRFTSSTLKLGLPWCLTWSRICLECGRPRFDPRVRKIPWRREWQPTPVFLPGEFH